MCPRTLLQNEENGNGLRRRRRGSFRNGSSMGKTFFRTVEVRWCVRWKKLCSAAKWFFSAWKKINPPLFNWTFFLLQISHSDQLVRYVLRYLQCIRGNRSSESATDRRALHRQRSRRETVNYTSPAAVDFSELDTEPEVSRARLDGR